MTLFAFTSFLLITQLFGWLFLVLPVFEAIHYRFFQLAHKKSQPNFRFADWYFAFLKALKQRRAHDPSLYLSLSRKSLLYVSLVLTLFGIAALPISSLISFGSEKLFADNGGQIFSPFLLLALILCIDFLFLIIGFTVEKQFVALSTVERSSTRQSALLVLALGLISIPNLELNMSLRAMVDTHPWGVVTNPISFVCACIAITFYLRQWQEDEYPVASVLRKTMQGQLQGVELVIFRIARSLEYLLLYAFVVVVFLGGPYLDNISIHPLLAVGIFTLKLAVLVLVILAVHAMLPRLKQSQYLRLIFLVLLPLELVSFPLSLFWIDLLKMS